MVASQHRVQGMRCCDHALSVLVARFVVGLLAKWSARNRKSPLTRLLAG